MFQLSETQAQEIVDKMMKDIPYNINIMNDQGVIIGSGKKNRVGTVHRGAVEALATGKMVEVWEDGHYEKKGTNEPIVIHQRKVGVIGITGNPDEVRPFCNIVRTTVSLLIEQRVAIEHLAHEASRKKAVLERLFNHQGAYTQKLGREVAAYQIDLLLKTVVLYMHQVDLDEQQLGLSYPSFTLEEDSALLLVQGDVDIEEVIQHILRIHPKAILTVGKQERNIAESYRQAKAAMHIWLALRPAIQVIRYVDVQFLVQLSQANWNRSANVATRLENTQDLLETLRCFINCNCSVSDTADRLTIHRNTLQYRLKRIETLTGKDPRNTLQLFELTYSLLALYKS